MEGLVDASESAEKLRAITEAIEQNGNVDEAEALMIDATTRGCEATLADLELLTSDERRALLNHPNSLQTDIP